MIKKANKYLIIMQTAMKNNLAYAANFFIGNLFYAFIIFVFLQLWRTIYAGKPSIEGYNLNQIIWYVVITEMITLSSGAGGFREMANDIKSGNIAYLLGRPFSYIGYQFYNAMGLTLIKLGINFATGIAIGLAYIGPLPGFSLDNLPFIALSAFLGICLNFFITACLAMTAFWFEENSAFFWIYQKAMFMLGLLVPIDFFPSWLKGMVDKLPFPYITYAPAALAVNFDPNRFIGVITAQSAYLAIFIALAFTIYKKGVGILNVNGG